MVRSVYLALALAACPLGRPCVIVALAQEYAFRHYGAEAGVPVAYALAFDAGRTLLVGTNDGLFRFDGRTFDPVFLPGVGETPVQHLAAGPGGEVWIIADQDRIFRLSRDGEAVEIDVPPVLREGLRAGRWNQRLRPDPAGRLWLNDPAARLWAYDPASARWTTFETADVQEVTDFFFEDAQTLWLADTSRVGRTSMGTRRVLDVEWLAEAPRIAYVRPHPSGAWVGTRRGVYVLDRRDRSLTGVLDARYVAWWYSDPDVDGAGRLFTCLEHGYVLGVYRLAPDGAVELRAQDGVGAFDAKAARLLFDPEGGSWVANSTGLSHLEQEYLVAFPVAAPDGTPEIVKGLVVGPSGGRPWIATWGGLYGFEGDRIVRVSPLPRAASTRPTVGLDGSVWWNDYQVGSYAFRPGGTAERVKAGPFLLHEEDDARYFSTEDGLFRRTGAATVRLGAVRPLEMPAARAGDGRLWIRTDRLDTVEGDSLGSACRRCVPPAVAAILEAYEGGAVREMGADAFGRIWVAANVEHGAVYGLACLYRMHDGSWALRRFGTEEGLLSDNVTSLFPTPDGRLWVGTGRGLQAFALGPGEPTLRPLLELRARDGLEGESIGAVMEDDAGHVWFGSTAGKLHRLDFRRIPRLSSPRAAIVLLERDGQGRPPGDAPLRLRAEASRLTIRLAAPTYRQPERVHFEYRLVPHSEDWEHLGKARSVQFPLLPAGDYVFEARAVREGSAPGPVVRQALHVMPPFYERWWFVVLLTCLCAAPFVAWHRYRLGKRVALERLRLRIATDLHDDIGSRLTEVSLYSELIRRATQGQPADWAERVGEMSRALLDSMRDIVWAINPEHESWEHLELRMKDHAAELLFPSGIQFEMTGRAEHPRPVLSVDVRRNVLLIFKEALHNTVRHASSRRVDVRWRLTPHLLWLQIADDGCGFDADRVRSGSGLANLRRRADEIGARLRLESAPGRGTRIDMRVPL